MCSTRNTRPIAASFTPAVAPLQQGSGTADTEKARAYYEKLKASLLD